MPSVFAAASTPLPPWLILAGLVGIITASATFMLVGRHLVRLPWYAMLGAFAASLGQVVGSALHAPQIVQIGDLNLLAASCGACLAVLAARVVGF